MPKTKLFQKQSAEPAPIPQPEPAPEKLTVATKPEEPTPLYWALAAENRGPAEIRDRDNSINTVRKLRQGVIVTDDDGNPILNQDGFPLAIPAPDDSVVRVVADDPVPFYRLEIERALGDPSIRVCFTLEEAERISAVRKAQKTDVANQILRAREQQAKVDAMRAAEHAAFMASLSEDAGIRRAELQRKRLLADAETRRRSAHPMRAEVEVLRARWKAEGAAFPRPLRAKVNDLEREIRYLDQAADEIERRALALVAPKPRKDALKAAMERAALEEELAADPRIMQPESIFHAMGARYGV